MSLAIGSRTLRLSPENASEPGGSRPAKKKRGWKKVILLTLGGLVVVLALVVALAPMIASSIAPGKIEAAAAASIKGTIKVKTISLGWFSPTEADTVQVFDPEGKAAATLSVKSPLTLWKVVSEHWWSATRLDVGEIQAGGTLDIVRDVATGKTNLERALEPRMQVPAAPAGATSARAQGASGGRMEGIRGTLKITGLDATVRDRDAAGKLSPEQGVKGLKGTITADYSASPGSIVATADLSGAPVGGDSAAPMKVKLDASVKPKAAGGLESFKVTLDVAGAPVQILDALAKQGGALASALGQRADVRIESSGTPTAATAKITLDSPGVKADLDLTLKDGVLSEAAPAAGGKAGHVSVKSTEFLASLPGLRETMAQAAAQVKLDKAPAMEITIEKLRWPVPPGMLDGTGGAGAMAAADFRGAGLVLRVHADGMTGRVAIEPPAQGAGSQASVGAWKPFTVDAIDVVVQAPDFAQPLTITGGTKATIDGAPAGDVSLRATASRMLNGAGKMRALNAVGFADDLDAEFALTGMSAALLQPVVMSAGLPLDLREDVGPTLDLRVQAKADVKGVDAASAGKVLPPIDATIHVASTNMHIDAAARYAAGTVTTTGDGMKVTMGNIVPLARRLMSKPGQPATLEISGAGGLTVTVKDFVAPMDKLSGAEALAAVKASINAEVSGLAVKPTSVPSGEQPVQVTKASVALRLDGVSPPQVDVDSTLSHAGAAFALTGQIKLDGIRGKLPASGPGAAQIIAFKPTGRFDAKGLPRSLAAFLPGAEMAGTGPITGNDMPAQVARALRGSIGSTATLAIVTQPDGAAQSTTIKLTTEAGGVGADIATKLTDKALTVSTLEYFLGMDPKIVNPVLAGATPGRAAPAPTSADAARSAAVPGAMRLAQAFRLSVKTGGPITVPLRAGTFEPDYAGASDAAISISTDNDIAMDNVPIGADASRAPKTTGVRVRSLKADIKAPLSGLAPGGMAKRVSATFSALAAKSGSGGAAGDAGATIADISGTFSAGMDGSTPDANIALAKIDCAVVESLLGKPDLLTGALGDKADANLRILPQKDGQAISLTLTAPRVSDAKIELLQSADRMAITKPSTITWRPDPAFLNRMLFPPTAATATTPAAPSAMSVTQAAPVMVSISKFAMAATQTKDGQTVSGPFKPGVFELDASITMVSVALNATGQGAGATPSTPATAPAPATPVTLEGLRAAVRLQTAPNAFGTVIADLTIDKVSGSAGAAAKKSTASIRVENLADTRGVLTQSAAVLNVDADLTAFPTSLVDQLAHQKGMLAELLGPTVDVQAKGTNVSMGGGAGAGAPSASGSLQVKATSPRASAEINGDVKGGAFVQTGPISVRITVITPQLVKMLAGALPLVESIEKTAKDEPAKLDATRFTIPIDGDLTKLSGDVQISPGVARFTTSSIFGDLVKAFGGKSEGALGQRIEPFKVHADKGVLTYEKFKLPAGQFAVETAGTVDLVRRQIDIVTYAPAGALTDKALGQISAGLPAQLRGLLQDAAIPFATKGPLDSYQTRPDLGLLAKELGDKIKKEPGKVLEGVLDLLNKKGK